MWGIKNILSIITILICINTSIYTVNAIDNINFKNITIEEGLSQSTVETMLQDSKGYLWFGTNDGLNRYNGYEFQVYKNNKNSQNSLVSNYIIDIKEDNEGNIWVGTPGGVSKINSKNDNITNYTTEKDKGNLSNNNVCEILVTRDGNILVATNDGLNLYDKENDKFNRILYKNKVITNQSIYTLAQDINGDIWIGTTDGLNKIDVKSNKIEKIYSSDEENSISDNWIYKIYSDKDGYLWIGTYNEGLNKINIENNEITVYKNIKNDKNSLGGNYVKSILQDSNGTIWVCTNEGLSKYVRSEDKFITYTNKPYDRYSIVDNNTFSIIEDKNGLILIGTYKGVSIFDPNNKIQHYKNDPFDTNSLSENSVYGVYEDDEGIMWVGTSSTGINIIDRDNETIQHIATDDGLASNTINAIAGYDKYIWIGTSNGLNKIDKNNKIIENYNSNEILSSMRIKYLYLDSKKYLWMGAPEGIFVLNTYTDEVTDLSYILRDNNVNDTYIETIYEDSEGNYWIGTFLEGNLIKIDTNNKSVKVYNDKIDSKSVRTIAEDDKYMWIGTSDGLCKLDKETNKFTTYTEDDGLSNNNIYGILIDDNGNLWMSTNNGISKFDVNKNKFVNLYLEDGLQSNEFNGGSYYKSSKGEFLFGGINGLNIFSPDEIIVGEYSPNVVFDQFIVKGEIYKNINNLEFKYNENIININYFLPNYKNIKGIQYQYKLDGIDEQWNLTNNNEIIYNNLSPGKYELKIKARNNNGVISGESSVKFTIKPPIWLSKSAYLVYFLLIILFIYTQKYKIKRLDKLVSERTKELSDEMEKNNELLNKVIQLERNKNNYFVNLSHELRTPLNVIFSTEQLITTLNKKGSGISKEKINYYMEIVRRNSQRLLKLINNIIDTNKVEHGNYQIDIKDEDIVYIVEEAALSLKDYIENKNIELVIEPDVEEKIIQCDKYEIERCIVNLISNAAKFTPEGGRIDVLIKDLGNEVEIIIKDTGIGIDEKYHSSIFDRFNQIIDEKSEVKGGSGLGLTITKHIIDLHNGEISVSSEVNKGSTFKIVLKEKIK